MAACPAAPYSSFKISFRISVYGRAAQGVKIMNLEEGVKVISFARTDHEEEEDSGEAAEEG